MTFFVFINHDYARGETLSFAVALLWRDYKKKIELIIIFNIIFLCLSPGAPSEQRPRISLWGVATQSPFGVRERSLPCPPPASLRGGECGEGT